MLPWCRLRAWRRRQSRLRGMGPCGGPLRPGSRVFFPSHGELMTRRVTLLLAALPLAAFAAQVAPLGAVPKDGAAEAARTLSSRVLSEAESARAVPDLFRLCELRDDVAG